MQTLTERKRNRRRISAFILAALIITVTLGATIVKAGTGDTISVSGNTFAITPGEWLYGIGIARNGTEFTSLQCASTGYKQVEAPYIHYYTYGYERVELRIIEYNADYQPVTYTLVSGNACGKVALDQQTAYVRYTLADWGAEELPAGYDETAVFDWQEYETGTYYFAANGDDANPGTEEAPKQNPDAFVREGGNIIKLFGGDTFECSLTPGSNTEITNYGSGMAILSGVRRTDTVFQHDSGNIYRIDIQDDVGCVWFEDGTENWKRKQSAEELANPEEYYIDHEQGTLYMYSEEDLTGQSLCYTKGEHGISINNAEHVRIMYIDVTGWGWNGISVTGSEDVRISECIVERIGGGQIHGNNNGMRFGNGIEVCLGDTQNVRVYQNIVRHIYDTGLTAQNWAGSTGTNASQEIIFDRNYVTDCFWGFEFATNANAGAGGRVSVRGNFLQDMCDITGGYRWHDGIGSAFFCIGTEDNSTMAATGNTCLGTAGYGIMFYTWANGTNVWFSDNRFMLTSPRAENVRTPHKYHSSNDDWSNAWQESLEQEEDQPDISEETQSKPETEESPQQTPNETPTPTPTPTSSPTPSVEEQSEPEQPMDAEWEGGTVWKAGYAWTMHGEYKKIGEQEQLFGWLPAATCISAMPPQYPIQVQAGERWHIKTHLGLGYIGYSPVIILNANDDLVYAKENAPTTQDGITVTIPEGGTKMYITYLSCQPFELRKELTADEEAKRVAEEIMRLELNTKTAGQPKDGPAVIFTIDDSRADLDKFADIFEEFDMPLCAAVFPENLRNCTSGGTETVSDVLRRIVRNGGEVLAHGAYPVTADNQEDIAFMTDLFAGRRAELERYGFDINGIMLAGGKNSDTIDRAITGKWAELFYAYSDNYGEEEPYRHPRIMLTEMSMQRFRRIVEDTEKNHTITVFAWHDANEVSLERMREMLQYLADNHIKVTTYADAYGLQSQPKSTTHD